MYIARLTVCKVSGTINRALHLERRGFTALLLAAGDKSGLFVAFRTQKMVLRAHIVLRCAQGLANHAMARELGVNRKTVILWRKRFAQSRRTIGRAPDANRRSPLVQCILDTTLHGPGRPRIGAPAPSPSTWASPWLQRVWKAHGLQPHRLETFKAATSS